MALTDAQKNRIRRLAGDFSTTEADRIFSDAELDQYYTDVGEDFDLTVLECYDVLLADAMKRAAYKQGSSSEDDSKVYAQIEKQRDRWAKRAGVSGGKVRSGDLSFTFYDEDGGPIPEDPSDLDSAGWIY